MDIENTGNSMVSEKSHMSSGLKQIDLSGNYYQDPHQLVKKLSDSDPDHTKKNANNSMISQHSSIKSSGPKRMANYMLGSNESKSDKQIISMISQMADEYQESFLSSNNPQNLSQKTEQQSYRSNNSDSYPNNLRTEATEKDLYSVVNLWQQQQRQNIFDSTTCNCRNDSKCLKNYCICHKTGKQCTKDCNCLQNCDNCEKKILKSISQDSDLNRDSVQLDLYYGNSSLSSMSFEKPYL